MVAMRMRRTWLGALLLVACSGSTQVQTVPPTPSQTSSTHLQASPTAQAPSAAPANRPLIDVAALRAALPSDPVVGFVRLSAGARLFSSRELASTKQPGTTKLPRSSPANAGDTVLVLQDLGTVLRVSTRLGQRSLERTPDPRFEIEAFVAREALLPVLRQPLLKTSADGTGYVLREGLHVARRGERIVPNELGLEGLPASIELIDVGLAFQSVEEGPKLPALEPKSALGCDRDRGVKLRSDLLRERAEAERLQAEREGRAGPGLFGLGARGYDSFPCSVNQNQAPVSVLGQPLSPSLPLAGCPTPELEAFRSDGDAVLVAIALPRATLRARASVGALEARGGCGMGRLGRRPEPHLVAKPKTAVYFSDGSLAGTLKWELTVTKVGAAGRVCVQASAVDGGLCFEVADLVEKVVMPDD